MDCPTNDKYNTTHRACEGKLSHGISDKEKEEIARIDMRIYRRLCQAVMKLAFDAFFTKPNPQQLPSMPGIAKGTITAVRINSTVRSPKRTCPCTQIGRGSWYTL